MIHLSNTSTYPCSTVVLETVLSTVYHYRDREGVKADSLVGGVRGSGALDRERLKVQPEEAHVWKNKITKTFFISASLSLQTYDWKKSHFADVLVSFFMSSFTSHVKSDLISHFLKRLLTV